MSRTLPPIRTRCAIYTRKSSEEGLEQAFNSLHAQREACEAYISSQRHEGWSVIPTLYDDGGFSGGSMERPALQSLLTDIRAGQIDIVVVYKIDRLTRSLFDFAKMVEIFDERKISFVSVTQSFNTTTSMGRLTLNVLLSFAQFEREVTGERIRDKVAASKKKGMWMGGNVPLGYDLNERKLVINTNEAETVRSIFNLYVRLESVQKLKEEVDRLGLKTKPRTSASRSGHVGLPFRIGHLYTILRNPLYMGKVHHKGQTYDGEHPPIITQDLWDQAQNQLSANRIKRQKGEGSKEPSLLAGLLYDSHGNRMTPTHAVKQGRRYRYYLTNKLIAGRETGHKSGLRLPAHEIESHVVMALCRFMQDHHKLSNEICDGSETPSAMRDIIKRADNTGRTLSDEESPDRYRLIRSLLRDVCVLNGGIRITLNRHAIRLQLLNLDEDHDDQEKKDQVVTLDIAAELKRLGKEKRLIVPAHAPATNPDPILIKALVRAHRWFEILKAGKVRSITDIAEAEKLPRTYVSSLIPLTFLAPDITEAIIQGRQPMDLNLDRILAVRPLPLEWDAQRRMLGIASK